MAAWQPEEMNSLYCHVMAHAEKFADVTCDGGAEAFNRELLQDAANNDEEVVETPISIEVIDAVAKNCLLYTSPSPRDGLLSRMPSSA